MISIPRQQQLAGGRYYAWPIQHTATNALRPITGSKGSNEACAVCDVSRKSKYSRASHDEYLSMSE